MQCVRKNGLEYKELTKSERNKTVYVKKEFKEWLNRVLNKRQLNSMYKDIRM